MYDFRVENNGGVMTNTLPTALLLLSVLVSAPVASQQQSSIKSGSELVLVPVEVRRHGQHVPNLTRDQFTITQDGVAVTPTVFEEVRTKPERLSTITVAPGEFTNQLRGDAASARYTVIAIDTINTTSRDMNRLRDGLKKFLTRALANDEPVRLIAVQPRSIRIIQDFTTDAGTLSAALDKTTTPSGQAKRDSIFLNDALKELLAAQEISLSRAQAIKHQEQTTIQFQERNQRINSLEALQSVALSLAGLPGRKSLVWASSGYSFNSLMEEPPPTSDPRYSTVLHYSNVLEATALDEYTTHILNTANIAVYPVDLRGTVNTAYDAISPDHKYSPETSESVHLRDKELEIATTFTRLAASTGGKQCYGREDVSGCFFDAMDDAHDYYMLGYYIDRAKIKPGWHKLNVKANEKGVDTRARGGFLYTALSPEQVKNADLSVETASRLVNPGLPFRGRWASVVRDGDARSVTLELNIPSSANTVSADSGHLNLEIAAVARREDGTTAAQFAQHLERNVTEAELVAIAHDGVTYHNDLHLSAGTYAVRVVVRDNNTGRLGSLTTLLKVD